MLFGMEVERKLTVANLIQIGLILAASVGGAFTMYSGVINRVKDVQHSLDLLNRDLAKTVDWRAKTEDRLTSIEQRVTTLETSFSITNASFVTLQQSVYDMTTKLDSLDSFLRDELLKAATRGRIDDR